MANNVKKTEDKLPTKIDFSADAGGGMEGADKDSFAIPFLRILQKLSPECDEAAPEFIEGAKPGMFYNTVNGKLYDGKEGVVLLPCAFQRRFLRWAPRGSEGAGFRGEYLPEKVAKMIDEGSAVQNDDGLFIAREDGKEPTRKTDDRLVDTRSHFGLVLDGDNAHQVVMPLSSTQIKKSKRIMSMLSEARIGGQQPPTWMNRIKLTTALESNDQGSWYGVMPTADGFIDSTELYDAGKAFHAAITAGEVGAKYEDVASEKPDDGKF